MGSRAAASGRTVAVVRIRQGSEISVSQIELCFSDHLMWQACQSGLSGQNARRSAERGWSQRGAVLRVGVVGRSSAQRAEREGWPVPSEDGRAAERGTKPGWPGRRDCPYCGASARCTPSQLPEAPFNRSERRVSERRARVGGQNADFGLSNRAVFQRPPHVASVSIRLVWSECQAECRERMVAERCGAQSRGGWAF